jgi:DNA polymerase III alpha subunit (gram-positive type)
MDRLMDRAAALGMKAIALTDHGNMFGAIEFYNAAKGKGIKPLIGCEIYITENSRLDKQGRAEDGKSYYHLGLLARNLQGYQNLLKLVSDSHLRGFYYKPRADFETLAKYAGGLIGSTNFWDNSESPTNLVTADPAITEPWMDYTFIPPFTGTSTVSRTYGGLAPGDIDATAPYGWRPDYQDSLTEGGRSIIPGFIDWGTTNGFRYRKDD